MEIKELSQGLPGFSDMVQSIWARSVAEGALSSPHCVQCPYTMNFSV